MALHPRVRLLVLVLPLIGFPLAPMLEAGEPPSQYQDFLRGDVNQDGAVQVADCVYLLDALFGSPPSPLACLDAADVNDDEQVEISDPVFLLAYLFVDGTIPPAPFGVTGCGPDPTSSVALSCETYLPCASTSPSLDFAGHVLRRMAYGPSPSDLAHLQAVGFDAYLEEQLHPELDDESDNVALIQAVAGLDPENDLLSLILWQVAFGIYSRNQLRETLTDFWENHFNTYLPTLVGVLANVRVAGVPVYTPQEARAEATRWEWTENATFRFAALGRFEDLLLASATGRPMLVYLDGISNVAGNPNENYARELLELHTMGVDNGYTQADIEEVARCFTGWTIRKKAPADAGDPFAPALPFDDPTGVWSFHFAGNLHDYGEKLIFPGTPYSLTVPARPPGSSEGILDGIEVLQHVAGLQQTAEFVSRKLIAKYVTDDPPPALVADALATWLATDGDLREVLAAILGSPEFASTEYRWNKIKTHNEYLLSCLRALDATTNGLPVVFGFTLEQTGLFAFEDLPFFYETPDGKPELGSDWLGSSHLLNRILAANYMAASTVEPSSDVIPPMLAAGVNLESAEEVADFWLERFFQFGYDATERQLAIDFVSQGPAGNPLPLDASAPAYESRIRAFLGFLLSSPPAHKQ